MIFSDDDLRGHVIWNLEHIDNYLENLELLRNVWPRQLRVRTPLVIGRLCGLAIDDEPYFAELVDTIVPLIGRTDGRNFSWSFPDPKTDNIATKYPEALLKLLDAVLPDDANQWPYVAWPMLGRLIQAKPRLVTDQRMLRLKGIWERKSPS